MEPAAIDTGRFPADQRFDVWRDLVHHSLAPIALDSDETEDFRATAVLRAAGPVQIATMDSPPTRAFRSAALIRRSDPEQYQFVVNLSGRQRVVSDGTEAELLRDDLVLQSTSHTYRSESTRTRVAVVTFDRSVLPLPPRTVDRLLGVRVPGGSGMPLLWSRLVASMAAMPDDDLARHGDRLGSAALDLLSVLLAQRLDLLPATPAEARRRTLVLTVLQFIDARLADPGLDPATVAAAHALSPRQLHRLFAEYHEVPVAAWIRRRRLERCRRDLRDPALAALPVHLIGSRWGFPDPSSFSRAFRRATGTTPRDYRHG